MIMKRISIITYLLWLFFLTHNNVRAQGKLVKVDGHYVGVLDFYNNHADQKFRVPHPNPANNGFFDKNGWAGDDEVQFRGLMKGAILNVDWWLLFGEPVVNYTFVWSASGSYEVRYKDPKKGQVTATVNRTALQKYPNLLKRFDSLRPLETNFEIRWSIGDQSARDREAFKRHYRLFGSIGGQAPHVKTGMTTRIRSSGIICEGPNIKPFSAPSSPRGSWKEFGTLPDSFTSSKISMLSKYFSIAKAQNVRDFRATQVQWPLKEFKAIAVELARLESGEKPLSPSEQVAAATAKKLSPYSANDEWAQAAGPLLPKEFPMPKKNTDDTYTYHFPSTGKLAFEASFSFAEEFKENHALVRIDYKYNLINRRGKCIFPSNQYHIDRIKHPYIIKTYLHSLSDLCKIQHQSLYDLKNSKFIIPEDNIYGLHYAVDKSDNRLIQITVEKIIKTSNPYQARVGYATDAILKTGEPKKISDTYMEDEAMDADLAISRFKYNQETGLLEKLGDDSIVSRRIKLRGYTRTW